jgi:hypothetical protein
VYTGVLYLAPWRAGVAVIVDGTDVVGVDRAVEHFPVRTGTTVPDYGMWQGPTDQGSSHWRSQRTCVCVAPVVVGPEQPWKAAGGLLAAGFWAYDWTYADASGYLR